jgi:adenylate cyclase
MKIKYPIGAKLVIIITLLLLVSLGAITILVSMLISTDVRITAEENNFNINRSSAAQTEAELRRVRSAVFLLLDTIHGSGNGTYSGAAAGRFFENNGDIAAVLVPGTAELINGAFFSSYELDPSAPALFLEAETGALRRAAAGELFFLNGTPFFGVPLMAIFFPWQDRGAAALFSPEGLAESFGSGANSTFMINDEGDLLVHADGDLVRAGANIARLPMAAALRKSGEQNRQFLYTDAGIRYFGAFHRLSLGNGAVITSIPYDLVFEGIAATTRRNIYLSSAVLFAAILLIWFFSKTISSPVRKLVEAAGRIEQGEFEIDLPARSHDELGLLTESFVSMGRGLAERERLKDTFGRFINRNIAEKAMKGELTLGGETKQATIFFSDIRDFTAISEKLEPHEVVEFLNDYMTRMVRCVNDTGGVVDKFIGDSLMGVWGAPISAGSPEADAFNCVRAALMMRSALAEFNRDRGGIKKPLIQTGCGINTGNVVAGQIGSSERMEYTVIGDPVNLASRTESLNKPLGTDILITENTCNLIREKLIVEEMPSITIKGKEKPVRMYAVINTAGNIPGRGTEGPRSLAELRSMLGITAPDMSKVNLDAEETKYTIQI